MKTSRLLGSSVAATALVLTTLAAAPGATGAPQAGASPAAPVVAPPPDRGAEARKAADSHVADKANAKALRKASKDTFTRRATNEGSLGAHFVAYERRHRGVEVLGGEVVVAVDAHGNVTGETNGLERSIDVDTTASVSAAQARKTSRTRLARVTTTSTPELKILAREGSPRLVWATVVEGRAKGAKVPSVLTVHLDARTGAYVDSWDLVRAAADDRSYYNGTVDIDTRPTSMVDPTRGATQCGGQDGNAFTGTDSAWGNGSGTSLETGCVDALYAAQGMDDMMLSWFGRDGVKGNGDNYPMRVGLNQANAYWNGSFTNFGRSSDGQRQVTAMDVVAHEQGHGLFHVTPGGSSGDDETGGLNEATGDIIGALTEHYLDNANDPADYLVGEEIDLGGSGPIRNMYNPSLLGDPNCYSSRIKDTEEHAAAGPLNHWFYLVAEGSNPGGGKPSSPICSGGPSSVTGLGIEKAGKIFYNGLLSKSSYWDHPKARVATLRAVTTVFPDDCAAYDTVKAAWNAVSVPAQSGEAPRPSSCGSTSSFSLAANPSSLSVAPGRSTTSTITIATSSGSAQDVSLTASGLPSGATASFSPATVRTGGTSTLTIATAASAPAGTSTVTVSGRGSTSGSATTTVQLVVGEGDPDPTPRDCAEFSGSAYLSRGYSDTTSSFSAGAGTHVGCLDGPSGADFDLYLQRWNGYSWSTVASGTSSSADEKVTFRATAGTYRWRVYAYTGSGTAKLTWDTP